MIKIHMYTCTRVVNVARRGVFKTDHKKNAKTNVFRKIAQLQPHTTTTIEKKKKITNKQKKIKKNRKTQK